MNVEKVTSNSIPEVFSSNALFQENYCIIKMFSLETIHIHTQKTKNFWLNYQIQGMLCNRNKQKLYRTLFPPWVTKLSKLSVITIIYNVSHRHTDYHKQYSPQIYTYYRQIVSDKRLTRIKMTKTLDCRHSKNITVLFYTIILPEGGDPPLQNAFRFT